MTMIKHSTLAVLLALLLAACGAQATPEPTAIVSQPQQRAVSATGQVVPAREATLAFPTSGQLMELNVELGDTVEEGDVIAQLETELLEAQLEQARANLAVAEANLERIEADFEADQAAAAEPTPTPDPFAFVELPDFSPPDTTQEDVDVAEAQVEQAQVAVDQAEFALEQATLRAPFSGTVAELFLTADQYTNAGTPAVTIAELGMLRIETTDLNELDVVSIDVGDTAIVTFDALPDVELEGTIARIAPKAAEGTGVNYTVVVDVDDLPEEIRWGMTAFIDIPLE